MSNQISSKTSDIGSVGGGCSSLCSAIWCLRRGRADLHLYVNKPAVLWFNREVAMIHTLTSNKGAKSPPKNISFLLKHWKCLFGISGEMLFMYTEGQNANNSSNYHVWFGCIWFVCSWSYSSSKVVSSSPPRTAESHRDVNVCASTYFWPRSVNMLRVQDSWELLHVVEDHSVEWFTMNNQVICLKKNVRVHFQRSLEYHRSER